MMVPEIWRADLIIAVKTVKMEVTHPIEHNGSFYFLDFVASKLYSITH
jgi:hypothetical protein